MLTTFCMNECCDAHGRKLCDWVAVGRVQNVRRDLHSIACHRRHDSGRNNIFVRRPWKWLNRSQTSRQCLTWPCTGSNASYPQCMENKQLRLCSWTNNRVWLIGRIRLNENNQPGFIELNSTFDDIQAQKQIDPRRKTTLMLACIEHYILSIRWGS